MIRSQIASGMQMRNARGQALAEFPVIARAPVKMLFPLIAFIFPCTFIVLFFPIVMNFMNSIF